MNTLIWEPNIVITFTNSILTKNEPILGKVADFRGLYLEAPKELDNNRGMYGYLRS